MNIGEKLMQGITRTIRAHEVPTDGDALVFTRNGETVIYIDLRTESAYACVRYAGSCPYASLHWGMEEQERLADIYAGERGVRRRYDYLDMRRWYCAASKNYLVNLEGEGFSQTLRFKGYPVIRPWVITRSNKVMRVRSPDYDRCSREPVFNHPPALARHYSPLGAHHEPTRLALYELDGTLVKDVNYRNLLMPLGDVIDGAMRPLVWLEGTAEQLRESYTPPLVGAGGHRRLRRKIEL